MMVWFLQWLSLLLFLLPSQFYSSPFPPSPFTPPPPPLCHSHESSALLHFKNSLSIFNDTYCVYGITNPNSTVSWNMSRDCCTWSGVTCDEVSGHVIRLNLSCSGLQGLIHSNSSLFFLTHLQTLVLSSNQFHGSKISPQFGRFVSMIHLDLSYSGFTGQVPLEFSYLSSLVSLDLSGNSDLTPETYSLKRIISNLTSLKELGLSYVNLSCVSTNSFMNLSETLLSLDLLNTGLNGKFPESIFHLPNLEELILSYNRNLNGSFPRYNWTSPLRELAISDTGFTLDVPYLLRNLKQLIFLDVSDCGLTGSLHALSSNITQITSFDLSNNNFRGQFPWDFLNLRNLTYLNLAKNNFEGPLPEICINSTKRTLLCDSSKHQPIGPLPLNLKTMDLHGNLLNGTLPSWLCSLPSLQYLYLGGNKFTGHVCEFQYNSLVTLHLWSNKLQGLIPRSIFQQVNLGDLDLSSNNFSGVIQLDQLSKLKNLQFLGLSFNKLSVDSIDSISALPSTVRQLSLSSCNITGFPHSLRSLENLRDLDLSNNRIEGRVPQWLWKVGKDSLSTLNISHNLLTHIGKIPWKNLRTIDLSSNQIQGQLPIPPPSTYFFSISRNQLVGEISPLFCNLSTIGVLDLSNNSLCGSIPPCFGNISSNLYVLDLRMNRFHGMIPPNFVEGNSLAILNLNENHLEGPLPQSLRNCKRLEILDVGNNELNGSFPHWLESLSSLQVLIMRANKFNGPLSNPKARFPFEKLRIMDISHNEFSGVLPTKYFENLVAMIDAHTDVLEYMGGASYYSVTLIIKGFDTELVRIQKLFITIDFSRNNFTGEIPKVIGKLNSLKGLNFSHNKLTGQIPPALGNLSNLEWLDLSSNKLSGNIPPQLAANLYQLEILNLSNNELKGQIPHGKQFDTFSNDSYSGNPGLCGFPLSKSCSNDEARQEDRGDDDEEHGSRMIDWKVVMMGYASGLVIGISIGYMVLFSRSFNYWFYKRFGGGRRRRTNRGRRRSN